MLKKYRTIDKVMNSDLIQNLIKSKAQKYDRVLKSTRLEDAIYSDLRNDYGETLSMLEETGSEKLSAFPALARDVFQSMYSLNLRWHDDDSLSVPARKFNKKILRNMLDSPEFAPMKVICEGRALPSFEAAVEFVGQIADNLDELLKMAEGEKNSMQVLEKLENRKDAIADELSDLTEKHKGGSNSALDERIIKLANGLDSTQRQVEALSAIVDDNLRRNMDAVHETIEKAVQAASNKAEEVYAVLMAWGDGSGNMSTVENDKQLLKRARNSKSLIDIAKHLGRFKEMLTQARKNSFEFGRGEKYSLELGNDLSRLITSEYALLATPETTPLFIKRYQQKTLKQYQRREAIYKGCGDIIVCLDESSSTLGDAQAWGKALAFALFEIAKTDNRKFALVHFSGAGTFKTDIFISKKYTMDDVMASAEHFFNGGTDFETPLNEALRLINDGFRNADVVFLTDGECAVSGEFAEKYATIKAERKFTVTGILLDSGEPETGIGLIPFCDKIYRTSELAADAIVSAMLHDRA